jgi:hypothetical protein
VDEQPDRLRVSVEPLRRNRRELRLDLCGHRELVHARVRRGRLHHPRPGDGRERRTIGAGEAGATLTFTKSATMTLKLVNGAGAVVGQVSATSSPLRLNLPGLAAGAYTYVVSGSGYKGSLSFTLGVTAPSP